MAMLHAVRVYLGSDHAGFTLKEDVRAYLAAKGHEVVDLGAANPS